MQLQSKMKVRIASLKCSVVSVSVINCQRAEGGDQNLSFEQLTDQCYLAIILVRMSDSTFSVENIPRYKKVHFTLDDSSKSMCNVREINKALQLPLANLTEQYFLLHIA